MTTTTNPMDEALTAHRTALTAQADMHAAALTRGQAIRAALTAGFTSRELAAHLGVSQRRIQAMANTKEQS